MNRLRLVIASLVALSLIVLIVATCSRTAVAPTVTPTASPASVATATPTPVTPASQAATPRGVATRLPAPAAPATSPLPTPAFDAATEMKVYFLDVGQGDSILLKGPDFTFLIDAGRHDRNDVVPYLEKYGVESIDLLIGTHPHADHIGQFPQVLERFAVGEVWMSGDTNTTKTFEEAIDAIAASGAGYHEPRAGEVYEIGSAHIEVLNPARLTGDVNEGSVSVRIVFGQIAFLFTGDAEEPTERAILARGYELHSQILKLGHHGSNTSSSPAFLQAVQPEVAIWSAATANTYGHPHAEVIARLKQTGLIVFGTAINSTIIVSTDGNSYRIDASRLVEVIPTPTVAPSLPPIIAVNRNVNLRVGPGTWFEVVAQLDKGTPVTPKGRNVLGDWVLVEDAGGQRGWVFKPLVDHLEIEGLPLRAEPTATATPKPSGCQVDQVNINSASLNELQQISQVGPARARQIRQLRPFRSIDDLVRVDGIAEGTVAIIKAQGVACVE